MVPSVDRPVRRFLLAAALIALGLLSSSLADAAGCPTNLLFTPDGISNLDLGWLGFGHFTALPGWSMRLGVTNCAGNTVGSCGECAISGLLPVADGRNRRCSNDTSIVCTDDAPCTGGHCAIYAAPPITLDIQGVASCVVNEIAPPVTGTLQVESGQVALTMPVKSAIYYEGCAACTGDPIENDGIRGGSCLGGARAGLACDAVASGVPGVGSTSFDCPLEDEYEIGDLAIPSQPLFLTTGTQTRTLTTASPLCTGDPSRRCHCETCDDAAATPCASDADCLAVGATTCGGKRCLAGPNAGAPCSAQSECPGTNGGCGTAGEQSKPNSCIDDTVTAVDGRACPDTAPIDGEGECIEGPFYRHCAGVEHHSACSTNANCPLTNSCILEHLPCFPGGGYLGATVPAAGAATARNGDVSNPTVLSALWCAGPSSSAGFNGYAAVPGLARLTLAGSITYADDPVPTPTGPTPTRTVTPTPPPQPTQTATLVDATPTPTVTATPGLCPPAPATCRGSVAAGKSTVALTDKSPDEKDQLQWRWAAGVATTKGDFGNPLATDAYVVCLYDGSGLRATMVAPAGGTCGTKPCWKDQPKGFSYKTKTPGAGGLTQIQLSAGADGKAKIAVKGKGAALPDVALGNLATPVTLQIRPSSGGVCFGSAFSFPPAVKNTAEQFKDKGD